MIVSLKDAEWPHMTKDEIIERINGLGPDSLVKVFLHERPPNGVAEGVWVLIADGDQLSGVGILLSNVLTLQGKHPNRGDAVEYRTVNDTHKPYIVNWVDGSGN